MGEIPAVEEMTALAEKPATMKSSELHQRPDSRSRFRKCPNMLLQVCRVARR